MRSYALAKICLLRDFLSGQKQVGGLLTVI